MVDFADLRRVLLAEQVGLDDLVTSLPARSWALSTAAPGWTVTDQVAHLVMSDELAVRAVSDPERFVRDRYARMSVPAPPSDPAELLGRWRAIRAQLYEAVRRADPRQRVPWFGPSMSVASMLTARLMETWAHGHDVREAVGVVDDSHGLDHIADLGVRTRSHSYHSNGLRPPDVPVSVELDHEGRLLRWGPPDVPEAVRGSARDFCLVVTRRRHVDDTGLDLRGPHAREWMLIAQAFAGPPGAPPARLDATGEGA